jgi:hypothetical protein
MYRQFPSEKSYFAPHLSFYTPCCLYNSVHADFVRTDPRLMIVDRNGNITHESLRAGNRLLEMRAISPVV